MPARVGFPAIALGDTRTMTVHTSVAEAKEALEDAAGSTWLERVARWGLAVRGVLYLVVAWLAIQVARGHREQQADKQGAMYAVVHKPMGRVALLALAVGFSGYALWRYIEALVGQPDDHEDGAKAIVKRLGYAARGALYTAFFVSAVKLLIWSNAKRDSARAQQDWTARVLDWPAGTWLVGLVGAAIVGGGLYVGWRGVSRKFRKRLKAGEMSLAERRWILGFGMVGMVARMVVTVSIGVFLVAAAIQHDANETVGIDGALKRLADRPAGPALLVALALGLAAYGIYSFAEARFRRVGNS